MELPADFFQTCLSPTDSSTPVRFQALLTKHAGSLHVEACEVDAELAGRVDWSEAAVETVATKTEGFSFAYIKELVTTSLMRAVMGEKSFDAILERECEALRANMKTAVKAQSVASTAPSDVDGDGFFD